MAQQLQNVTINAPAFGGINTQDSPVGLDPSYASVATNCVIDKLGRVGARKGSVLLSTATNTAGASAVSTSTIKVETIFESLDKSGDKVVFSAGNNKIFSGTSTLTNITPSGYTISANNWKVVNFNNHVYFYQRGHEPLVYTDESGSGVLEALSSHSHSTGTSPYGNEVLAAYGRLWVADITNNKHTIYWSDTLNGHAWTGGTTGSIDLTTVWPTGHDEIVSLAAHNGFLIVFGKTSIVVYSGASSPASMALHDTVEGVGCVARDSVQHTGTDIVFLSDSGVRSFGRVIQEKSMPMRDISRNVRNDLVRYVSEERIVNSTLASVKSTYSPEEAFYLLTLPNNNITYCFDMRQALPDGSHRVTTWSTPIALCYTRTQDGKIYMGRQGGIYEYKGFTDRSGVYIDTGSDGIPDTWDYETSSYQLSYFSNPLDFGNSSNIKFLKKFKMTIIGDAAAQSVLNWGYDYSDSYYKQTFTSTRTNANTAFYGVSEYNVSTSEYSAGTEIQVPNVQGSGHGTTVTVGLESTINGSEFSIQKIDINVLLGRLI